ncbi:hypothetical protein FACS189413_12800 [Bacteroidia bacterium]|nr:hypothetical protein FACS189413_12800 [Bacteroidia bacterium]
MEEKGFSESEINNPINMRAMQWENNQSKNDNYPEYKVQIAYMCYHYYTLHSYAACSVNFSGRFVKNKLVR